MKRSYAMNVEILVTVKSGEDPWDKLSDWFADCFREVPSKDISVTEIITGDWEEESDDEPQS